MSPELHIAAYSGDVLQLSIVGHALSCRLARDGVPSWQLGYGLRLVYSGFLVVVAAVAGFGAVLARSRRGSLG